MEKLLPPFGEATILIDGKPLPYFVKEGRKQDVLCLHVLGRYQIVDQFIPGGEKHTIMCL